MIRHNRIIDKIREEIFLFIFLCFSLLFSLLLAFNLEEPGSLYEIIFKIYITDKNKAWQFMS
jgi:hypothetical protein